MAWAISALASLTVAGLLASFEMLLSWKRRTILERLRSLSMKDQRDEDDILKRPFLERTIGAALKSLFGTVGKATPERMVTAVGQRLASSGNPGNAKPEDFLASMGMQSAVALAGSWLLFWRMKMPPLKAPALSLALSIMVAYLKWFGLGRAASKRQAEIRRGLPDLMDLLVVSVEAGLAFDMALLRVVEKLKGPLSQELQRVLKEMQLGKPRKDALRDMAERAGVEELSGLVSAIIQGEQLGVGVAGILRLQSDLIRDKRQQFVEEQSMKAPIKMLFPLVFFIFPSIFVVILGPAVLNIVNILTGTMGGGK